MIVVDRSNSSGAEPMLVAVAPSVNGHAGVDLTPSSYVRYLPTPYQGDEFLGRFLHIIESIIAPIEMSIDSIACYFDPGVAPIEVLPWLASWVGVELDENWPIPRTREL